MVAGAFAGMQTADWVVAGPRERLGAVLRGCAVERLADPATGARPYKLAPCSGAPGARALHAVGLALGSGRPVLCFLGLASAASGATHEAFNAAALTGAGVVFLHAPTVLLADAPVGPQLAGSLADIAQAHGLHVTRLALDADADADGAPAQVQAAQVQAAVAQARERAAAGAPQLLALDLS